MRMYFSVFKMKFVKGLQYRSAAFAGGATNFFFGFMYIMIFTAFYNSTDIVQPISLKEQVQVIWLRQAMLTLFVMWQKDGDIIDSIMSGDVAYELCRPTQIYSLWFSKIQGRRLAAAFLKSIPIIVVASIIPEPYRLNIPMDMLQMGMFFITLIGGMLLSTGILIIIYVTIFRTLSPTGSILLFSAVEQFFAGAVVPIPLMPEGIKTLTYILPFRYTFDLPFRIFAGNIGMKEALYSIPVQIFWLFAIVFLGKLLMKKTMKKIVIQGG